MASKASIKQGAHVAALVQQTRRMRPIPNDPETMKRVAASAAVQITNPPASSR
jgi:hypothetical protein